MEQFSFKERIIFALVLCFVATVSGQSFPCVLRETKYGSVCVCNATYCDYLEDPTPVDDHKFVVVSSSKAGLRFDTTHGLFNLFKKHFIFDYDMRVSQAQKQPEFSSDRVNDKRYVHLEINREKHFQKITGFGGSHTGAVTYLTDQLPPTLQDHLYESFYAERGIGFNLMRIPLGGCDFDLSPWAYNEYPENDAELTNFTIDARDELRVAQIRRLIEVSKVKNLRIKGAAWSSPRWMKSNNAWTGFSHLKKEYYQTWVNYHIKWIEMMEEQGLPIWAISTGNEPMNGVFFMFFVRFMSLGWTPKNQAIWLNDYLGPTIRNSKYKDLVLFGNDDQRYTYPYWFKMMNSTRENSLDYLDGLAVHWYWDEMVGPSLMDDALKMMPDKILLTTESCIGDKPWQKAAPLLGSWYRGEKYARAYLQDLQHGFNGWIDWNIILDEAGGPNYVNNTVDAPVIANTTDFQEFYKQPMFYTIGHFSKFIPEGSIRIESKRSNVNVDEIAFLRPDGTVCVVIFNSGKANVEVSVVDSEHGSIVLDLPAKSIHTLLYT
ncbi:lysosomal acid glucosylceramidase-like [Teleopsis dalmanni]|uniref:lysosomal acid glucosylceramidase-like n=1 Tax=Teleopsis dalmanni TaxID=139649 RepID=UPI0018CF588D|nr:lysosomal acid glucosylceramidase-like [Teleopsis dalmanni]